MLGDVRTAAVGDPLRGEGVGDGGHDAELDQRGRDVRAADRTLSGDTGDLRPLDGDTQLLELGHHRPGARHPVVPYELTLAQQVRLVGVEEIGQQMQAHPVDTAGEFGAGDQGQALGERGDRLGMAAGGVVVGERDDVESGRCGIAYQLGRSVRAVRCRGVGVQINAHDA